MNINAKNLFLMLGLYLICASAVNAQTQDVCSTPAPKGPAPTPYPNIALTNQGGTSKPPKNLPTLPKVPSKIPNKPKKEYQQFCPAPPVIYQQQPAFEITNIFSPTLLQFLGLPGG